MERLTSLKSGLVQIQPLDTVSILHMLDEIQQSVIKATQPPDYNQVSQIAFHLRLMMVQGMCIGRRDRDGDNKI